VPAAREGWRKRINGGSNEASTDESLEDLLYTLIDPRVGYGGEDA